MFWKKLLIFLIVFIVGFALTWKFIPRVFNSLSVSSIYFKQLTTSVGIKPRQVTGFLPYWLLDRADKDYTSYLSTLTYFGLTISPDGTIKKFVNPGETEPGWYALNNGKVDTFLNSAKSSHLTLSLLVFNGDPGEITGLISDPASHAATLIGEIAPVMGQYGFTDLNLDIENTTDSSPSARTRFTQFVTAVRTEMNTRHLGTLTLDVSPTDLVRQRLVDVPSIVQFVDSLILMTYDYHFAGSAVTGPVAPIDGVDTVAEFDSRTAVEKALESVPRDKLLLGVPLYGYEWETLGSNPRVAVIPDSGQVISHRRSQEFLSQCATCSAQWDPVALEQYVIYKDQVTGVFHQAFFPSPQSIQEKIKFSNQYGLSGVALWALGYEGSGLLDQFSNYKYQLNP